MFDMYIDLSLQLELTVNNNTEDSQVPHIAGKSPSPATSTVSIPPAAEWLKPGKQFSSTINILFG